MPNSENEYPKTKDSDLGGSRRNFLAFLSRLRQSPSRALALSFVFLFLGVAILVTPHEGSAKFVSQWQILIPSLLAFSSAMFFFAVGVLGFTRKG